MRFFLVLIFVSVFIVSIDAQPCSPPAIVANAKSVNIFSPEQEMILGELTVQQLAREFRPIRDPKLLALVEGIGEKVIKHIPNAGPKFRFHIIDYPTANAFNIPGGHIFVSRKLIALVHNEDELASVIAHELGHAAVHHGAVDLTDSMKRILNVTSVGDRRDIIEKYNRLIENARTKRINRSSGHENEQQLEADAIGLFAMVAAGYDPNAMFNLFDRLTESEGKTGSWFGALFGNIKPAQKRLREMANATSKLPQNCRDGRTANTSEEFLKWQADVVRFRESGRQEELPGLIWRRGLEPKLRSDITHLAFSPNGMLLLAQDDFGITVIEREPLRVLFQIPAEEAQDASFTPDGEHIVFTTENLRFEKWNIPSQTAVAVREVVIRSNCQEHALSPDGNFLACVDMGGNANIVNTNTGLKVWEKKEFYQLWFWEILAFFERSARESENDYSTGFFRITFSPDSKYVMFSRSDRYRFRFSVNYMTAAKTGHTAAAVDLTTMKEVGLDGNIKSISAHAHTFIGGDKILGIPWRNFKESGVFSFPDGKRLQKFEMYAHVIESTQNENYVVLKPTANSDLGLFDLSRREIIGGMKKKDLAVYGSVAAFEATSGKIVFREVSYNEAEKKLNDKDLAMLDIPAGSIGNLRAAAVSDSLNWLAISSKTRGGLWDLATGERKLYVRGFRGAVAGDDGGIVGHFPKVRDAEQALALMNPIKSDVIPIRDVAERGVRQYGRFVLTRIPLKGKPEKKGENKQESSIDEELESDLNAEVKIELKDLVSDKVIWTRDFPKDVPRYSFDEQSGRLVFYWQVKSESLKSRMKEDAALRSKADSHNGNADDYLVEIVDAFSQSTVGIVPLATGKGSFSIRTGLSEADWLVLYDTEDRVLAYSIKDGALRHRFFGNHAAINPRKNQVVVENFPGEINLYNLDSGESEAKFVFNGSAVLVRYNFAGDKLFVLTDLQTAYAFDLKKLKAEPRLW